MPSRLALLRALAWITLLLVIGLEVADYGLRFVNREPAEIWRGGAALTLGDVTSTVRALVLVAMCSVLLSHAGDRMNAVAGALTLAFYAGVAAAGVVGEELESVGLVAFFYAVMIAAVNAAGIRLFQIFPQRVERFDLNLVLRFFVNPVAIAVISTPPLIAYFFDAIHSMALGIWGIATVVLQLAYLRTNLRHADPDARKRLFWVLEGMVLILLVNAIGPLLSLAIKVAGLAIDPTLALLVIWEVVQLGTVACFAVAIFFHDALNAGLVVKRTFAAGLASSASLVVFIALETVLGDLIAGIMNSENRIASIIAGIVAALLFKPIQATAEKLFARFSGKPMSPDASSQTAFP